MFQFKLHPAALLFVLCMVAFGFNDSAYAKSPSKLQVQTLAIQRADDSTVTAYVERGQKPSKQSVLLVLQGSICESVAPGADDHMEFPMPTGMARLDIEKYAITAKNHVREKTPCPVDYLAHNTIDQRVIDVLTVISWLRGHAPWWNGKVFVMGTSAGATVAAMVGPLMTEIAGIVLVNGSIGRPFKEGWADAMVASVAASGGDVAAQKEARDEAVKTWAKARRDPTANEQAFGKGNTLKWWNSIIDLRPSNLLMLTDAPILLMQSDHDEMTPVTSARVVNSRFKAAGKTNLTYVELPGLTHGLRTTDGKPAWEPVLAHIRHWLEKQNAQPNRG